MTDLPDTSIQNMIYPPFISMVRKPKFTLQKNAFYKKNYSGHGDYFFSGRGIYPLPPYSVDFINISHP